MKMNFSEGGRMTDNINDESMKTNFNEMNENIFTWIKK